MDFPQLVTAQIGGTAFFVDRSKEAADCIGYGSKVLSGWLILEKRRTLLIGGQTVQLPHFQCSFLCGMVGLLTPACAVTEECRT